MKGRYFYTRIAFYLVLLVFFSALSTWLLIHHYSFLWLFLTILATIICGFKVAFIFKKIQGKITYFFNAVENNDSTLFYSENIPNKSFRELHKSLNRVNHLIKEVKLKNEEQEQYFSVILEQVATGIVVLNSKGNILQANSSAKQLLRYDTLTHIVQLKRVNLKLYEAFSLLTEGKKDLVELTHNHTTTQLSLQATQFEIRQDKLIIVAIQDISNELEDKEVESWIKLIRVLTHEIMNSISPITSLSDTLMGYYQDTNNKPLEKTTIENTLKGLKIIKERGESLIQFVNSYRKLTKISPPILKPIQVKNLIEHIVVLLASESHSKIVFQHDNIPEHLTLKADEGQVSQVLINLIKNAIQAVQNVSEPIITISAERTENQTTYITVEDNGIGISETLMEQIFIPFFTTKENGSGIGLSISRQIMRNHNGSIKLVSKTQEGSRFILEFVGY